MNIPKPLLTMIDVITVQLRTEVNGKPARRTTVVKEIVGLDPTSREILVNEVFRWNTKHDNFLFSGQSHIVQEKRVHSNLSTDEVQEELHRRKKVLDWMVKRGIRQYIDVASIIRDYYADPSRVYRKARMGSK
jgi:flagellar protein FlaI